MKSTLESQADRRGGENKEKFEVVALPVQILSNKSFSQGSSLCIYILFFISGFPGDSMVKNPPTKQEMQALSLGQENPLEKLMALQYSCLKNSRDGGAWRAAVHGVARAGKGIRENLRILDSNSNVREFEALL